MGKSTLDPEMLALPCQWIPINNKITDLKEKENVRGQPELNRWPLDLQSNALPLSYTPDGWLRELKGPPDPYVHVIMIRHMKAMGIVIWCDTILVY